MISALVAGLLTASCGGHPGPAPGHHLSAPLGDGSFLVYEEVDPGTYSSAAAAGKVCTWERSSSADPTSPQVITRGTAQPNQPVTAIIDPNDARFITTGCAAWTRVDPAR